MSTFYLFVFRDWPAGAVQTQQLQLLRGDAALADGVVLHEGDVAAVHEAAQRPLRARVRVLDRAAHPGVRAAAQLAQLVAVVPQRVVALCVAVTVIRVLPFPILLE